jgi:hypothetical protein
VRAVADPATGCVCAKEYYAEPSRIKSNSATNLTFVCQACPTGADCSRANKTLTELTARPGYWRASADSKVFTDCAKGFVGSPNARQDAELRCCPLGKGMNVSVCERLSSSAFDADAQCKSEGNERYGGPMCLACFDQSYTMTAGICSECDGGASIGAVVGVICGFCTILFIVFAMLFFRAGKSVKQKSQDEKTVEDKINQQRNKSADSRFLGDQALAGRMAPGGSEGANGSFRSDFQVIIDRVKVVYSWLQCFTALTIVYDINWPVGFQSFSVSLNFINLDLGNILGTSSCSFALPFIEKFYLHMLLPLFLVATACTSRLPAYFMRPARRKAQRALLLKLLSTLALVIYRECRLALLNNY